MEVLTEPTTAQKHDVPLIVVISSRNFMAMLHTSGSQHIQCVSTIPNIINKCLMNVKYKKWRS